MTHFQILLHELAEHGQTTYRTLVERYGDRGYTYEGFTNAAMQARNAGLATGPDGQRHGPIVKAGVCPCCGRTL